MRISRVDLGRILETTAYPHLDCFEVGAANILSVSPSLGRYDRKGDAAV